MEAWPGADVVLRGARAVLRARAARRRAARLGGAAAERSRPADPQDHAVFRGRRDRRAGTILAQKLGETLAPPVVVGHRPGGTSSSEIVARALGDGHTLLMTGNAFAIGAHLSRRLPFDPLREFAPVAPFGRAGSAPAAHPSLPARSVREPIELARSRPDTTDYACSGDGSVQHLVAALLVSMAGLRMRHVPYKGSGPATAELLGGQVKVGFPDIPMVIPHHRAGRMRALAVVPAQHSAGLAEVPSLAEAGVPRYEATLGFGIAAPRSTPRPVVVKLHRASADALRDPACGPVLPAAASSRSARREAFGALLRAKHPRWGAVVREIGLGMH